MKIILKKSKFLLFGMVGLSLFFGSCSEEPEYTVGGITWETGGTVLGTVGTFDVDGNYGEFDINKVDESTASYQLRAGGDMPSSVGVNITHSSGASGKIGDVSSFPSDQVITFAQALAATGLSVGDMTIPSSFTVTFDVPGFNNNTSFSIPVIDPEIIFRSALQGDFDAVAVLTNQMVGGTNPWDPCDGLSWDGTVKYVAEHTDPEATGTYVVYSVSAAGDDIEDMSHGAYYPCYNADASSVPLGDLRLTDVDGKLAITGASQWDETYTISNVTPADAVLSFNWVNSYGEGALVSLTRTDGELWPDNLN